MARSRKKLGDILVEWGVTTPDQIEKAVAMARGSGRRLGDMLVEMGASSDDNVAKALAKQFGLEFVDLSAQGAADRINPKLIPEDLIRKHHVLPLKKTNGRLQLIMEDPMNLELADMLRFRLNTEIETKLASPTRIRSLIDAIFGGGSTIIGAGMVGADESLVTESIDRTIDRSVDRSVDKSIDITVEDAPIIRLVNRIIAEAVRSRASDIHIEPMADRVRLRYRIDGVCIERDNLPKRMQNALLSRVKLMAGVNIAEKRLPQDGRIKMPIDENTIDFRVSSCPAYHGESIVLRILRPESVKIGLVNLGFEEDNLAAFNRIIRRPNGIFLVTGPTGSGKTTTLYSALDVLNRPDRKIITAEDPVEYTFAGINQCQVRDGIGLTFAAILRSMLRQAPDVILIGEIRDKEVAEIAIQAALTGHLVFSTLHTNDAPSAITRLIDMGVKPFLVASSIQAVMAQRLIRVLCTECKVLDEHPDPKYMRLTGISSSEAQGRVYKAEGCAVCSSTGFKGRRAIFEMMVMNSQVRDLAFKLAPLVEIRQAAIANGMRTLVEDGKTKILKGITTPGEVARMAQTEGVDLDEEEEAVA
ncbi:MAG: Flp pilus assembly complex ATPase component TadA [Planctomycetes bacterium]|nr:Flp pilus assembly complex ATPase component TadA [Planctomycetota bacterium]